MKKILIIGANGFTGRQILNDLSVHAQYKVTGCSLHPDLSLIHILLPEEWGNYKHVLYEEIKEITEVIEGTFRQYPIRLAWAITIHKSQGLTFELSLIHIFT